MKIRGSTLLAIASFFLVFFNITYIPYQYVKYGLILIVAGLLLIDGFKLAYLNKHIAVFSFAFLFVFSTLLISYINRNSIDARNPFLASIVYCVILLELLLVVFRFSAKGEMTRLIQIYSKLTFLAAMAVDALALVMPNLASQHGGNYLNGTKFGVMYLHYVLIVFYVFLIYMKEKKTKKRYKQGRTILFITFIWSFIMAIIVDCVTGMVGILMLALLLYLCKRNLRFFTNPLTFFLFIGGSFLFMWVATAILSNPTISEFVTETLHTSGTLTGRLDIYQEIPNIMAGNWWLGFGYGSSYEIVHEATGYANTQNGIMNWILEIGIVGTSLLVCFMTNLVSKANRKRKTSQYPFFALAYLFLVLATVEITITVWLFAMLIIAYGLNKEKQTDDLSNLNEKQPNEV